MKKILILMLNFLLIFSLSACSNNEVKKLMNDRKYKEAYELIQSDKNKYGEYQDECSYLLGKQLMSKSKYNDALIYLEKSNYKGVEEKVNECNYYIGMDYMNDDLYDSAIEYFEKANYKDSSKKLDECKYYIAKEYIEDKKYSNARSYLENCNYADSKELLDSIQSETKNYYTVATTLTKSDLTKDSLGMYSYDGITLLTEDCEWVDSWLNKNGTVEQGALYRKLAASIEGFNRGFNNGSSFSKHILGFSTSSREEFSTYASDLSTYIVKENSLKSIMSKFSTLGTVSGKIDVSANSYNFNIIDLKKCSEELKISEEMLGYILADLDEYGPTVTFGKNDYSFVLN